MNEEFQNQRSLELDVIKGNQILLFLGILSKHPNVREPDEIEHVTEFMSKVVFFQKLKESHGLEAVRDWWARLKHTVFQPGQNIITYREVGKEFYIIIDGKAKIYIPFELTLEGGKELVEEFLEKNDTLPIPSSDLSVQNLDPYETIEYDDQTKTGKFHIRVLKNIAEVSNGSAFGELSLITNKPRAATIVAQIPTITATLNRDDYELIILPLEEKKLNDKISFLKNFK